MSEKADEKDRDRNLTVQIGTPNGRLTATFPKTTKVSDVIVFVIREKGLEGGSDAFELFFGEQALAPDRPLISFGIKDGDTLLLAATGSGV